MTLRRKPQSESKKMPSADERRIEALIDKGGSVAPDHEGGKGRPQLVQLRLPRDLVQRIDMARKHRIVRAVPSCVAARSASREAGNRGTPESLLMPRTT